MGRSSWRAKSCRTCIARKVKCDKHQPQCLRCQSSSRTCGGYLYPNLTSSGGNRVQRPGNFSAYGIEKSLAMHQSQRQLISLFLNDYLPPHAPGSISYQSPVYWAETFFSFLDSQSTIVNDSLSALTLAHLGSSKCDATLAHQGRYHYGLAMQKICALQTLEHPTSLVRTGMILALYELYSHPLGSETSWQVHVQGAYNLMRASKLPHHALSRHDRRRLFTIEFLRLCMSEQRLDSTNFWGQLKGLSSDMFDRLLEILSQTAYLLVPLQERYSHNGTSRNSANTLLQQSVYNEGQLLTWFHELQLEDHSRLLSVSQHMLDDTLESTQDSITYTNPSSVPLLALYWLGLVVDYTSMAKALRTLIQAGDERSCLKKKLETAELLCCRLANRLSQWRTKCMGVGQGTAILLMATSSAVEHICQNLQGDLRIVDN